jgi:hypothetical protein
MRLPRLTTVALLLCLFAPAIAWPGGGPKLPRAIDSPVVRPTVRDDHKAGLRQGRHPSKLQDPQWGRNPGWLVRHPIRPLSHYLK